MTILPRAIAQRLRNMWQRAPIITFTVTISSAKDPDPDMLTAEVAAKILDAINKNARSGRKSIDSRAVYTVTP